MLSTFQVREAYPADAQQLADVAERTFPLACPPTTPQEDIRQHIINELSEQAFLAHMESPTTEFHVAVATSNRVIGYLMLVAAEAGSPDVPGVRPLEVRRIYVDQQWQRHGVGSALVDAAVRRGQMLERDFLWLGTNQANVKAVSFYERLGFAHTGTRTFRVGSSLERDFLLARPVRASATQ